MCANVSETVYLRINSSRCVFNLGISKPLTFSWGGHKKLAVGYTSGNVVVWNVEKALHDEQSRTGESTRRCVIFSSNVLDAGIRSLCWNGVRDPERMIIGGLDGRLVHLDTNDPHINLLINRARGKMYAPFFLNENLMLFNIGVQLNCGWQGHDTIMLYVDADGLTRGCAFNADGGLSFNKLGDCTGMCWSIGTSEHHGHFALSTAIGWVRTSNMYQVKLKKLLITQNTVYKLHYNHDTGIYRYIDGIGPQTLDEAKKLPVYSQYGDSQMSIQKVAWNPNKPTCAFLASGGAAGLCRIDFEGRGSNWE
ncbi:uncharacterized protein B0P05DRAFT_522806 [Gilbertella persicaria]|uniref:uncharacterized protein n=1 Tax=Gilbertella persicaria TaxID=101096 RepID=UPI00221FE625|nr:uncharacterized protein B0P05DRAFT_522806 [Gilbertella persicaria]KAI8097975.1 hypothetical protein B0P05DRAFT_522806 [Gilbertella persicaria]